MRNKGGLGFFRWFWASGVWWVAQLTRVNWAPSVRPRLCSIRLSNSENVELGHEKFVLDPNHP